MNFMTKATSILLAATLMCSALFLGACGNSGEVEYKVTVVDAIGNTYGKEVLVRFMQDGSQVAMQVCDENGVATKTLAAGEYDIQLKLADSDVEFVYEEGVSVSAKNPETEIELVYKVSGEPTVITAETKEYDAYHVSVGCTSVELVAGERTYFLFTPTVAGKYEFSVAGDVEATIGYYGAPHFVQANNAAEEVEEDKFFVNVKEDMISTGDTGTTVLVLGVDSDADACVVSIQRIGDPDYSIEDEPWTIYKAETEPEPFTLDPNVELEWFDVFADTDDYKLVYNEEDGFYHLDSKNGPLVYVQLVEDSDYLASFFNILDRSGVVKYFFDEDGEFVKKESYSECLMEYIDCSDEETGVYPLTEDLKYIIQQRGEYVGWWNSEMNDFIFKDTTGEALEGLNTEIAWLFMCCYEK